MKSYLGIIPKYFCLNKKRMMFTIVGIILSIMLMTALSLMIDGESAGRADRIKAEEGYYHVRVQDVKEDQLESLRRIDSIEAVGYVESRGDFLLEGHEFALNSEILDKQAIEMFKLELTLGDFPEAENEIAINEGIAGRMSTKPSVGDTVQLKGANKKYIAVDNSSKDEKIKSPDSDRKPVQKEFIISGFYKDKYDILQNAVILDRDCPEEISNGYGFERNYTYIKFKEGVKVKEQIRKLTETGIIKPQNYLSYNNELLQAIGQETDWSNLAYKLIFSLIIGLTTIASIYNVFYISVVERIRHYGMLRSVGSSPKQVRRLVIAEGLVLCLIALPFGLLLGILTAWIMHIYMPDVISNNARFIILPKSLVISALLAILTIFLSILKPAFIAGRVSPVEAISNSGFRIGKEKFKARRWQGILSLFGISSLMAYRNLWRNKKKFLVTVFSLCLCTIMFITFSYLLATMFKTVEKSYNVPMAFSITTSEGLNQPCLSEEYYNRIIKINGIEKVEKIQHLSLAMLERSTDQVSESFKRKQNIVSDRYNILCRIIGVEDEVVERAVLKSGSIKDVLKEGENSVIVVNNWPANRQKSGLVKQFEIGENITFSIWDAKNKGTKSYSVKVAAIANNSSSYWESGGSDIKLIFNNSNFSKIFGIDNFRKYDIFTENNADKNRINMELTDMVGEIQGSRVIYYEKEYEGTIEQGKKIKTFYFGAIGLLSFIGVFNIFNSVSAGLVLRTREFATLKAVGMTDKQIRDNVCMEGLFHGIISSIWGAILGTAIAYIFYCVMNADIGGINWQIPWLSILISTAVNIAVCLLATAAPLKRISQLNIIEGIRTLD